MAGFKNEAQWRRMFADRLWNEMKELEMTQRDFAKHIGVAHTTLHEWLHCECTPHAYSFIKVVERLGLDLSDFTVIKD